MTRYLALTIGPIFKTLQNARHTRELWAASYMFSYLMKKIVAELRKDPARRFVIPYVGDEDLFSAWGTRTDPRKKLGAGLFPDRLIYRVEGTEDPAKLEDVIQEALSRFGAEVARKTGNAPPDVIAFLKAYFRFCILAKSLDEGANPVLELSPYLDAMELQPKPSLEHKKYLEEFFYKINKSFLVEDGYCQPHMKYSTLIEIGAKALADEKPYKQFAQDVRDRDEIAESSEHDLIRGLKDSAKEKFRAAHKYVAVVHSDGDNVGQIIQGLSASHFQRFSQDLSEYSLDAVSLIDDFGGLPVYAGGDDLLFFAPVINGMNHLIRLLTELDKIFKTRFGKYRTTPPPSLSFGASITYHKFPLFEALEISRRLLFDEAKTRTPKNNIALRVQKHSGQSFGGIFHTRSSSFKHFAQMLDEYFTADEAILNSLMHKVGENEKLFALIGKDYSKVDHFISNSFNEPIHKENPKIAAFLGKAKHLINSVFLEHQDEAEALENVYGMLRTMSFLIQKDEG